MITILRFLGTGPQIILQQWAKSDSVVYAINWFLILGTFSEHVNLTTHLCETDYVIGITPYKSWPLFETIKNQTF